MPKRRPDTAAELLAASESILISIVGAGIDLSNPVNMIALQLLGPVLARVMGDDPKRSMNNLLEITALIDIEGVKHILRQGT